VTSNDPDACVLKSSIDSSGRAADWKPVRFPPKDPRVECCALQGRAVRNYRTYEHSS
jgi:hypothetical protein